MKRFVHCLLLVLFTFTLVACGGGEKDNKKDNKPADGKDKTAAKSYTIGLVQTGAESSWRTAQSESLKDEIAKRGHKLKFYDAQGKAENQIQAVRDFITQGVDIIAICPIVDTGWEPVLKEAKQAKIPVFLISRGVNVSDESLYVTKICSDFVNEGRLAAEWLAKKTGGKANIIELVGTPGADVAKDRKDGFAEGLKKSPDMKIIASQSGNFERTKGKEVMEALIKLHPEVNAVYAHNDDMALGAIQAIAAAGKKPGADVVVVSIDAVKGAFEAMIAGTLNCTIECPALHGPWFCDALDKFAKGETLPKHTVVAATVFEQEKAKDLIGSRKY